MMEAVEVLREYQGMTFDELARSPKVHWAVQHGLQLCVQAVLDLASHLVAVHDVPVHEEYRNNLLALAPLGVLPEAFARRIAPMAGFRNILLHQYLDVDLEEVHTLLNEHLDDFAEFAQRIEAFLESREEPGEARG